MLDETGLKRLDQALNPRAVAIIGATQEADRVGYSILESILLGGFPGRVLPIHPRHKTILGQSVYASLDDTGEDPDLAIIALNERATIRAIDECGRHNVKGAICVAGGYKEIGEHGTRLQTELVEAATRNNVMLVGPNTLGVINAQAHLNATFWPIPLERHSSISVISQSGGVGQMIGLNLLAQGITLNKWFGVGNRAMLDFDDFLQYLLDDPTTNVVAVFIEGTENARAFVEVAGGGFYRKPIVALKAGKSDLAQQCALTHTGSMAGSYKMYQDIFEQFGILPVESVPELVSVCKALALAPLPAGDRVGILTPSAGPSIILADLILGMDCKLASFSSETMRRLEHLFAKVPVVLKNPLDATALGYSADSYTDLAELILQDSGIDLLLAISIDHKNRTFPAEELVRLSKHYNKPVVVYYISEHKNASPYRTICQAGGVPLYLSAEEAAWGVAGLIRRRTSFTMKGGRDA